MKIKEFMKNKSGYKFLDLFKIYWVNQELFLMLYCNDTTRIFAIEDKDEIQDLVFEYLKKEIRFCDRCGVPMDTGYTDSYGGYYSCTECFPLMMDEQYGSGKWRVCEEENELEGFYEYLEGDKWIPDSLYYTEWC